MGHDHETPFLPPGTFPATPSSRPRPRPQSRHSPSPSSPQRQADAPFVQFAHPYLNQQSTQAPPAVFPWATAPNPYAQPQQGWLQTRYAPPQAFGSPVSSDEDWQPEEQPRLYGQPYQSPRSPLHHQEPQRTGQRNIYGQAYASPNQHPQHPYLYPTSSDSDDTDSGSPRVNSVPIWNGRPPRHRNGAGNPIPIIPCSNGPMKSKIPSPWSAASSSAQPVLDTERMLQTLTGIAINVNPSVKVPTAPNPFPLIVDLRMRVDKVWKRPKPGFDEEAEKWTGHDEPATMPRLNEIFLVSPYSHIPIRVANRAGVTCGDVINALHATASSLMEADTFKKLPFHERSLAYNSVAGDRDPQLPGSVLPPAVAVGDTWHGRWAFEGLRKDDAYVKQRLGWSHPACFVVNLARPQHMFVML